MGDAAIAPDSCVEVLAVCCFCAMLASERLLSEGAFLADTGGVATALFVSVVVGVVVGVVAGVGVLINVFVDVLAGVPEGRLPGSLMTGNSCSSTLSAFASDAAGVVACGEGSPLLAGFFCPGITRCWSVMAGTVVECFPLNRVFICS